MKTTAQATAIFYILFAYAASMPTTTEEKIANVSTKHKENTSPCITEGCLTATATYLDNMDMTVNPCEDFYDFACGKFSEHTLLTIDNPNVNVRTIRRDQHLAELRIILEDWKHLDEPDAFWKAKDFFFACSNISSENPATFSIQEFLESFGEFPLVEGEYWKGRYFNWVHMYTKLAKLSFSAGLFNINFLEDEVHSSRTMLIRPSGSLVSRHVKKGNSSDSDRHVTDLIFLAGLLGADDSRNMTLEAKDVIRLSLQLNAIGDLIPSTEEEMTVNSLQESVPQINWKRLFTRIYEKTVSPTDPIVVVDLEWIKTAADLLDDTDKRTVANYMLLETLFEMHHTKMFPFLATAVQAYFYKTGSGPEPKAPKPLVVYCLKRTSEYLSHAVAAMHARKYFTPQDKMSIHKIESSIRDELRKIINAADFAAEDAHSMDALLNPSRLTSLVGFYDEYFDDNVLEDIYRHISVNRKDHLANMLAVRKFALLRYFGKHEAHNHLKDKAVNQLGQVEIDLPLDKDLLVVPVSALRGVFYHKDRTHYLNYGALGFVVGRGLASLVHALSKELDVPNDTLSSAEVSHELRERQLCYAEQYLHLKDHHQKLTSGIMDETVVEELIKDTLGLRIAQRAYEKWLLHHSPEPPLPALEYTPKQLFWISFANTLCHSYEEDSLTKGTLLNNIPGKLRVLTSVRNTPEFARDFDCPTESLMNPKDKCPLL